MAAEPLRVALLARPGPACDRLRGVLDEAGARRVLEADPTALELPALIEAAPQAVLVALDPATEDVLARFDDVLFDPAVDVIYEEAELTASREGWDAARWQRHLVAKLQRHGDVLPPGREPDATAVDRIPVQPGLAESVPQSTVAAAAALENTLEPVAAGHNPFDPVLAELDDGAFHDGPLHDGPLHDGVPDDSRPDDSMPNEVGRGAIEAATEFDLDFTFEPSSMTTSSEPGESATMFDPVAAEATIEPAPAIGGGPAIEDAGIELDTLLEPLVDPAPSSDAAVPDASGPIPAGFGELSLVDDPVAGTPASAGDSHTLKQDMDELERRISGLELVDDTPVRGPEQARGAVLVLAGIGGPDAVRQLLGALPPGFARPVLVQQHLDGARYDKLVAQMQRATALPVQLAEAGQPAQAGSVYIMPPAVGIDFDPTGIRFNAGGDVLAALPSADSAVLLLSGSDPGQVDAAMKHSWAGALVAGQAADGCYDAAASSALAARGGDTAPAIELAQRLAERWS